MTPPIYQHGGKDPNQAESYDESNNEPRYDHHHHHHMVQPAFPSSNSNSNNNSNGFVIPNNPSAHSVFHPAAWQPDMNSMVFMDALQSWGQQSTHEVLNDPRSVAMGLGWQQPTDSLMMWDMQPMHNTSMQSPYPAQPHSSYDRTVFKTEKPLEETWESGWVEELPPALDAAMHHPVSAIPHAIAINMPVERPAPAHAPRKRRRVPSPMTEMPVYNTPMAENSMRSPEGPLHVAVQPPEQQQPVPPTTSMFMDYERVTAEPHPSPMQQSQTHDGGQPRIREPTPKLEEMPEYDMLNIQPHPAPPAAMPQSPPVTVHLIGPVVAPRGPTSKVRRGTQAVFKTQSANSKRGHYASDVWEGHKTVIKKLYIDDGKPLREVIKIMETDHGFPATQRMYKARFKQWGFVKNNTEKVVSQILRTKFERDAAGKLSHFTRNGKDVNLQNYLQRKGLTEYDLVDFAAGGDSSSSSSDGSGDTNGESSNANTLLAHVRCRTPPTDIPGNLRLPDRLRFQDTLVMSFKRAFLLWRQEEQEKDFGMFQPSVFTWRVTDFPHLSNLMESARLIRKGDSASGIAALNQAFWSMNGYLTSMDATASFYFFFHRQSRPWQEDARIALAVWKFLAAYASARNHNNHPLFHTFKLMYEVIQKEGTTGLRSLLTESSNTVADELEKVFGREHWLKDLIWHRCFPEKSKLRHLQLIRDLRDHGPASKIVKRLY